MESSALTAEDRFGIFDLFARYAWALDTANPEGYAAVFTPDGLLGMSDSRMRGRQEIRDYGAKLTGTPQWAGSQHYNGQLIIEGNGSRATVRSYSMIVHRAADGASKFKWLGVYRDVCVKVDGRWLFEERLWTPWDPAKLDEYRQLNTGPVAASR